MGFFKLQTKEKSWPEKHLSPACPDFIFSWGMDCKQEGYSYIVQSVYAKTEMFSVKGLKT